MGDPVGCAYSTSAQRGSRGAVARRRFLGAAFCDPERKLVAVETIVTAVDEDCGRAALEIQERRHRAFGRSRRIPYPGDRLYGTQRPAVERARDLDLVRDLIVHDPAPGRGIELLGTTGAIQEIGVDEIRHHPQAAELATDDDLAHP